MKKEMHAKSEAASSGTCRVVTGGFDDRELRQFETVRASVGGTGGRSSAPPVLGAELQGSSLLLRQAEAFPGTGPGRPLERDGSAA